MKERAQSIPPKWLRVLVPVTLILVWFGLAGLGGPYFGRIEEVSDIDLAAFLPKSAEATKVNEEAKRFRDEKSLPAIIVFEAKDNGIDQADTTAIQTSIDQIAKLQAVDNDVSPPILSEDKKAAFVVVPINGDSDLGEVVNEIKSNVKEAGIPNADSYVTGPAGFSTDLNKAFSGIDGLLLGVALAVVFAILLVVYRSPLLPLLVLLTSVFALAVSILIVWQLASRELVQLNGQVQGILFILVIGAATDYSLLYVSRYKEELHRYAHAWPATVSALKGAFEPIIASGGTVIVGLLCLLFSDLASNKALGPVGSIGIVMAVVAALTLLPALLYVCGRASFWPFKPRYEGKSYKSDDETKRGVWQRVGGFVTTYPRRIWLATTAVLLVAVIGVFQLNANGVSQSDLILGYSEARKGQEVLNRYFPDGSGSPALVITPADKQDELVEIYEKDKGVESVSVVANNSPSGVKPLGREEADIKKTIRSEVEKQVEQQRLQFEARAQEYAAVFGPDAALQFTAQAATNIPSVDELVEKAYPFKDAIPKQDNGEVMLQVTLKDAPDSVSAERTIERVRLASDAVGQNVIIGGTTAAGLDSNTASLKDRVVIIPLVLAAITLILMVLLRSIIAPILLLLTTVLSFGATLGIAALLFNHVWGFPGADPSVVLYAFVFLVALGIDYNIFLMTRVHEESLKVGTSKGVINGLIVTGGVITSAGVVLAATFAALAVIPILFLAQLAFIVAFGVLLDTLIIRSLLVPALIRDAGSRVWWPSSLSHKK